MTRVKDMGEFPLIGRLARHFPPDADTIEGIGDDAAVVRVGTETLLLSCDLSVEDIHFRRDTASPEEIGWKAAAAAWSDIAAMGGRPRFGLLSLACPGDENAAFLEAVAEGVAQATRQAGGIVVGGDMTASPHGLTIDMAVVGKAPGGRYLCRRGAQSGDALVLIGSVGRSAAGLDALSQGIDAPTLAAAHRRPQPRYQEGPWLAQAAGPRALIDVSDGLVQDAGHLAKAAGIGVDIHTKALPVPADLAAFCQTHGRDPLPYLLGGGEDYALAAAVDAAAVEALARDYRETFQETLPVIGQFTNAWTGVRVDGQPYHAPAGWQHFRND